ncbi:AbrB/MazE/SpoVT family DNA-binding domain-containing protein [Burkholderia ubonensis]|uniref:AbrB/MazE/SpoVT family DNA-binding domain-containing protein n=1 Tax=Burkholderia ubonensis TaxID=101571 RepID=UPI000A74770A|nr:hypothetical protein [Burkholderia ubonensis]
MTNESEPNDELLKLLAGVTPENRHAEVDFGRPVGREIWPLYDGEDRPAPDDN